MNFKEYQAKTFETVIYPNFGKNPLYAFLGFCGELSELIEKLYFYYHPITAEEIVLEAGDCFYYISVMAHELNIDVSEKVDKFVNDFEKTEATQKFRKTLELFVKLNHLSGHFSKEIRDGASIFEPEKYDKVKKIFLESVDLFFEVVRMIGIAPDYVMEKNIEKLFSRKERNQLKGEGDSR